MCLLLDEGEAAAPQKPSTAITNPVTKSTALAVPPSRYRYEAAMTHKPKMALIHCCHI